MQQQQQHDGHLSDVTFSSPSAAWSLPVGQALTLRIGAGRELQVTEGRLWLTLTCREARCSVDVWLSAGDRLPLAAGSSVVIEAWPAACFELLVPPAAAMQRRPTWWLRGLRRLACGVRPVGGLTVMSV